MNEQEHHWCKPQRSLFFAGGLKRIGREFKDDKLNPEQYELSGLYQKFYTFYVHLWSVNQLRNYVMFIGFECMCVQLQLALY